MLEIVYDGRMPDHEYPISSPMSLWLRWAKNGQIKGLISNIKLILSYTALLVIPNLCTEFDKPKSSSC